MNYVPTPKAPPGWREALDRSEAQLAKGEIVPGHSIIRALQETIAAMDTKRDQPTHGKATQPR